MLNQYLKCRGAPWTDDLAVVLPGLCGERLLSIDISWVRGVQPPPWLTVGQHHRLVVLVQGSAGYGADEPRLGWVGFGERRGGTCEQWAYGRETARELRAGWHTWVLCSTTSTQRCTLWPTAFYDSTGSL